MLKQLVTQLPVWEPDSQILKEWIGKYGEQLLERMPQGHLTVAGFIFNPERTKTLMVFHNIYQSWSWTGGHVDGDADLLRVALREAQEETGVKNLYPIDGKICTVDVLPVKAHIRRGQPVAAHVHLNVAYALECGEEELLQIRPEENSDVRWLELKTLPEKVSLSDHLMLPIYKKIMNRYRFV